MFHGCSKDNVLAIVRDGFSLESAREADSYQRYGLGFYFALNSSKAHDYPIKEMTQRPPGSQRRKMLLCRVATGREFRTRKNLDRGETVPPPGYDSVHGEGGTGSTLNWDELVVYSEEAVLPYAVVEYGFAKVARSDDV